MSYVPPSSQHPPPRIINIFDQILEEMNENFSSDRYNSNYNTLYSTYDTTSAYMTVPSLSSRPMDDASPRKIEYFSTDDLKYGDVALRNLKTVLRKRRIRNIDECFSILENLSPRSLEQMVKNIVNKNNKDSVVKMLRKLKLSDPIVMHQ